MTSEQWEYTRRIISSLAMDPALNQKCLEVLADYQRKRLDERKDRAA